MIHALLICSNGFERVQPIHPSPSLPRSADCSTPPPTRTCGSGLHAAAGCDATALPVFSRAPAGRGPARDASPPLGLRPRLLTAVPPGRMRAFHDEMIGRRPAPHDPARGRTPRTGEAGPMWVAPSETWGGLAAGRLRAMTREAGRMWIRSVGDGGTTGADVRRMFDPRCGSDPSPTDPAHPGLAPGATHIRPALRVAPAHAGAEQTPALTWRYIPNNTATATPILISRYPCYRRHVLDAAERVDTDGFGW